MFKVGLMKFPDARSSIEIIISYRIVDHEVIIDSKLWNVYESSIPDEFIDIHNAHPDYVCPHVCMTNDRLCPYICPHKTFDSPKKACQYFNDTNNKRLTTQEIEAETSKMLHDIYREQAKLKWEDDVKAFRDEFNELTKKYGFDMEVVSEDYGDDFSMDAIRLKRNWNSLGESMSGDLIYLLSNE